MRFLRIFGLLLACQTLFTYHLQRRAVNESLAVIARTSDAYGNVFRYSPRLANSLCENFVNMVPQQAVDKARLLAAAGAFFFLVSFWEPKTAVRRK